MNGWRVSVRATTPSSLSCPTARWRRHGAPSERSPPGAYRGPLHGIPYGLKDLFAAVGAPTSWGATPFKDQVFDHDSTVARKLEEAGAVLLGKLALVEIAGGIRYKQPNATFTGPGINPWGGTTWAGGSSSGSASAVSAGLVPFAIGSETWGSIIMPSSNCGIAGLRPTYGRVSRAGGMPLSWTLDKPGPMCLTADDCGLVVEAIAGPDPNDLAATDRPFTYSTDNREGRYKLGVPVGATDGVEPAVKENFEAGLSSLERVADIEEVELPDYPYGAVITAIFMGESATIYSEFTKSGRSSELTAPEDRYGIYARSATLATDYLRAMRIRKMIARDVDALMSRYDAPRRPRPSRRRHSPRPRPGEELQGTLQRCDGCVRQLHRPARRHRAVRLLGGRPADLHPVHGQALR